MKILTLFCAAVLLPCTLIGQSSAPLFIPLGQLATPPEGLGTAVLDLSGDGMIAVGMAFDGEHSVAARWSNVGGWQSLGYTNPLSAPNVFNSAKATNFDGSVVAGNIDGSRDFGFVWRASTGVAVMPLYLGGQQLVVKDLSRNGRFVAGQADTPNGQRGYRFDLVLQEFVNPMLSPTAISGVTNSSCIGVSDDGGVLAGAFGATGGSGYTFVWTPTGGLTRVTMGTAAGIGVSALNADGTIMGGQSSPTLQSNGPPVRWVNNVMTALPVPPGGTGVGSVSVMSGDGVTLGGRYIHQTGPFTTEFRSFVWRQDLGAVELGPYLTGVLGINLQGLTSLSIEAISQDGSVWAGAGSRNARTEGWMLRLPGALPLCVVDLGMQGGVPGADGHLDNNDFVVFISDFFTMNARADLGRQGGLIGGDSEFNNNDFIAFIELFFSGCP